MLPCDHCGALELSFHPGGALDEGLFYSSLMQIAQYLLGRKIQSPAEAAALNPVEIVLNQGGRRAALKLGAKR